MYNEDKQMTELKDIKYNTRTIIMILWFILFILFCFIYRFTSISLIEILFFKSIDPKIPFTLFTWLIYHLIIYSHNFVIMLSLFAILSCLFIKKNILKWLNIVLGVISTILSIINITDERWYQLMYSIFMIGISLIIVIISIKWEKNIIK